VLYKTTYNFLLIINKPPKSPKGMAENNNLTTTSFYYSKYAWKNDHDDTKRYYLFKSTIETMEYIGHQMLLIRYDKLHIRSICYCIYYHYCMMSAMAGLYPFCCLFRFYTYYHYNVMILSIHHYFRMVYYSGMLIFFLWQF